MDLKPPNQIVKNEVVIYPSVVNEKKKEERVKKSVKLSPLSSDKGINGDVCTDLVPIIAEKRGQTKIPLGSTDVTRGVPDRYVFLFFTIFM